MIAGRYFVTPHAVKRFRQRIIRGMTYEQALGAIINGLERTRSEPRRLHDGTGWMIRCRRPYNFRAVVKPTDEGAPAVVTILRSGA